MMLTVVPHDANTGADGCHMTKRSFCNHFNHLNLSNAMVPLVALLAACGADTSTNGST